MARRLVAIDPRVLGALGFSLSGRFQQMAHKDNPHVAEFKEALETWTDERFLSRDQLWGLAMFFLYIVNLSDADGWQYDGHSMKVGSPMCTLTVKAHIDGVPYVVFTSGNTTVSCVRVFIRKLEEGLLEWRPDQYRQ